MISPDPRRVSSLLAEAGRPPVNAWTALAGGANNRVWRGDSDAGPVLLKAYFYNPSDPRDRLKAERAFYTHAINQGISSIPQPLGWDLDYRLGLFEFIDGGKLTPDRISLSTVRAAATFVCRMNEPSPDPRDPSMPNASEACFSMQEHLETIERRVRRLLDFEPLDPIDHEAAVWIRDHLSPAWNEVRTKIDLRPSRSASLETEYRWFSPSDFGFHNALHTGNWERELVFFDFEYAGWDDPAKLICDFFCQPAIPVPLTFWSDFIHQLATCARWDPSCSDRAAALLPCYQIKWCCIILNEFLKTEAARRSFAAGNKAGDRREQQLTKAQSAFDQLFIQP